LWTDRQSDIETGFIRSSPKSRPKKQEKPHTANTSSHRKSRVKHS